MPVLIFLTPLERVTIDNRDVSIIYGV